MQSVALDAGLKLGTWKEPPWSGFDGSVTSPGKEGATVSPGRLWVFRLLAAVLACGVVLGAMEGGLRLAGVGWESGFLVRGEAGGRPVWNENPRFTWRFMPPELGRTPQPMSVPVEREPGSLRVLVLGESAAMGDPEPAYGYPRVVETLLEARLSGRKVEVVNAAVTAINSHVIREIAEDCRQLKADVWVVYMGNNEVTGPFGPGTVFGSRGAPGRWVRWGLWLKKTRTGQWLDGVARRLAARGQAPKAWGGLEMFLDHQVSMEDPRLNEVRAAFESNLRSIVEAGRSAGARVIVGTVAVNQRDSAPFGSQVPPGLDAGARKQWEAAFEEGKQAEAKEDAVGARRGYDQALKQDAGHAELMFRRARLAAGSGDTNAVLAFARARDLDTLRFRADSELNEVVRKVASKREAEGVWLMDAEATFAKNARFGVPGNEFFWEHVHFRLPGSYLLALLTGAAVLEALPESTKAGSAADWISLDEVAQRLAVTSWGDFRIADGMRSRLRRPPFSTQAYAADREVRFQKELTALAKGVQPTAFAAQAEVFRKRLAQRPDDWVLHDQLGRMHESFGDVDGALSEWKKVIELMPHHFAVRLQMGRMLAAKDESAVQAEPLLREALAMRPATAEVHAVLGQALARQKKYAEAHAEFAAASRLRPDLLDAEVQWGIAFAAEGKAAEARKHLERALEISTNSALAHLHLARLSVREGNTNAAKASYGEVLRLSPNYREAQEFLGGPPISP